MDSKGIFGIQDLTKKYSAGFGKTQAILTEKRILQLPGKRDWPKFKHGTRAGLFCLYVDNSANYTFERQMINQPGARLVLFPFKPNYRVCLVNFYFIILFLETKEKFRKAMKKNLWEVGFS